MRIDPPVSNPEWHQAARWPAGPPRPGAPRLPRASRDANSRRRVPTDSTVRPPPAGCGPSRRTANSTMCVLAERVNTGGEQTLDRSSGFGSRMRPPPPRFSKPAVVSLALRWWPKQILGRENRQARAKDSRVDPLHAGGEIAAFAHAIRVSR